MRDGERIRAAGMPDEARPGAIPAIGGAEAGDEKQDPVRIPLDQPRRRHISVFAERVVRFAVGDLVFGQCRKVGAPDGLRGVGRMKQMRELWRDAQWQAAAMAKNGSVFVV